MPKGICEPAETARMMKLIDEILNFGVRLSESEIMTLFYYKRKVREGRNLTVPEADEVTAKYYNALHIVEKRRERKEKMGKDGTLNVTSCQQKTYSDLSLSMSRGGCEPDATRVEKRAINALFTGS